MFANNSLYLKLLFTYTYLTIWSSNLSRTILKISFYLTENILPLTYEDQSINLVYEKIGLLLDHTMNIRNPLLIPFCGQNAQMLNIKAGGKYRNHHVVKTTNVYIYI
jgi:hypothetical protein